MNKGFIRLDNGSEVYFTSCVYNPWAKVREFLTTEGWVSDKKVVNVTYLIGNPPTLSKKPQ